MAAVARSAPGPARVQAANEDGRQYDVCLSFAGEQRAYVERVAAKLHAVGIRVFYDKHEQVELWGKDLYDHLDYIYGKAARYCVLFVSGEYAAKLWTNHERKSAQARAFKENREYVLPARFDDTEIPGLRPTVAFVDLRITRPAELAKMIEQKLGPPHREEFLPPLPDLLFKKMGVKSETGRRRVTARAYAFFQALRRMSNEERRVVVILFLEGCTGELPKNVHVSADLLRRLTGLPTAQLQEILKGLGSLGFVIRVRASHEARDDIAIEGPYFELEFHSNLTGSAGGQSTREARAMVHIVATQYCLTCATEALANLDFSALATATAPAMEPH